MNTIPRQNSTNAPEWIALLPDADLRALAYLCGQVETYTEGALPTNAANLSRAAQQEQARRDKARRVTLTSPAFIPFTVALQAGPK